MARKKNINWNCGPDSNTSLEQAQLAVQMDIRDELQDIKRLLECHNIQQMFNNIRKIDKRLLKKGFKLA